MITEYFSRISQTRIMNVSVSHFDLNKYKYLYVHISLKSFTLQLINFVVSGRR